MRAYANLVTAMSSANVAFSNASGAGSNGRVSAVTKTTASVGISGGAIAVECTAAIAGSARLFRPFRNVHVRSIHNERVVTVNRARSHRQWTAAPLADAMWAVPKVAAASLPPETRDALSRQPGKDATLLSSFPPHDPNAITLGTRCRVNRRPCAVRRRHRCKRIADSHH